MSVVSGSAYISHISKVWYNHGYGEFIFIGPLKNNLARVMRKMFLLYYISVTEVKSQRFLFIYLFTYFLTLLFNLDVINWPTLIYVILKILLMLELKLWEICHHWCPLISLQSTSQIWYIYVVITYMYTYIMYIIK